MPIMSRRLAARPSAATLKWEYLTDELSLSKIAAKYGVSKPTARRWLVDAGIPRRKKGGETRRPLVPYETVADEYLDGLSAPQVADGLGMTQSSVRYSMRRARVEARRYCYHGDADTSPGYAAGVEAVAEKLGVDPAELRELLVEHGIRGYQRPGIIGRV